MLTRRCRPRLHVAGLEGRDLPTYDFTTVTAMMQGTLTGLGVGSPLDGAALVLLQHNQVIYQQGFGDKTPASIVPTASAGKTVSAAVIMALVDQGLLDLNSTAGTYYPGFATGDKALVNLRQLMAHTSGISAEAQNYLNLTNITLQQCVQLITNNDTLDNGPPGTKFAYGGASLQVAGGMAELTAG